jgi:hypothetical protein
MEEPRAGVVRDEPDRDVIVRTARAHNVAAWWSGKVRRSLSSALDY